MRLLITFIITIMITATAVGQKEDRNAKKERIQALKVAYITEKLALTPDQAQVFWPIYNTYGERMSEIYNRERKVLKETRDLLLPRLIGGKIDVSKLEIENIPENA